jgi:hypothetical protein
MPRKRRISRGWVPAALLLAVVYVVIGRVPLPGDHLELWRLTAAGIYGVVYLAHIAYEHFMLHNSTRSTALHVAAGVGLGGIGLAVAGMIHSFSTTSTIQPRWLLALVIWPASTAIPAFLGALVAGALLSRFRRRADAE